MKYIVVQWQPEEGMYHKAMRVLVSNHPRFLEGTRYDFGFLEISSCEGYTITVLPSKETLDLKTWKNGTLRERKK